MSRIYLEVTYRKGRPFAAYLYLPRKMGDVSARVETHGNFVIDYTNDGRPIGIEILDLNNAVASELNALMDEIRLPKLDMCELAPLTAA